MYLMEMLAGSIEWIYKKAVKEESNWKAIILIIIGIWLDYVMAMWAILGITFITYSKAVDIIDVIKTIFSKKS